VKPIKKDGNSEAVDEQGTGSSFDEERRELANQSGKKRENQGHPAVTKNSEKKKRSAERRPRPKMRRVVCGTRKNRTGELLKKRKEGIVCNDGGRDRQKRSRYWLS